MATNVLNVYDPISYAQEALILLEKRLGRASRVHRGYEKEAKQKGSTIEIGRPSTFVAQDAPSNDQNLETQMISMQLNYWKEVKFALTDKELSYTGDRIIQDHLAPAVYALADDVDQKLAALANDIPWYYTLAATTEVKDFTRSLKVLKDNNVPTNLGQIHAAMDSTLESGAIELMSNFQTAGATSAEPLLHGSLGTRFGAELFGNGNVGTHTKGTCSTTTLAVNGAATKGASTINLDAVAVTGTVVAGDSFVIAGHEQRYAVTSTCTAAGNALGGVTFTPPLAADAANDAVVTMRLVNHTQSVMFHSGAFALAMAPLSEIGSELGARVATITDPKSGLSIRSRLFYVGDSSTVKVALDILYAVKTLNPNMAVIMAG